MKPFKKAVALSYQKEKDPAPRLVAKGKGRVAETIIELAQHHDIPLYEDPNLSDVLETLDLNTQIPPELFRAVAEVLAFVYRVNQKMG